MCQNCAHRLLGIFAAAMTAAIPPKPDHPISTEDERHIQFVSDIARVMTLFVPPAEGEPKPDPEAVTNLFIELGAQRIADLDNALGYFDDMISLISTSCAASINAMAATGDATARRIVFNSRMRDLFEGTGEGDVTVVVMGHGEHPNTGKPASTQPLH